VANYWRKTDDGRYSYPNRLVSVPFTDVINNPGQLAFSQPQYSARYVLLDLNEHDVSVSVLGDNEVSLFPSMPPNSGFCWWSNRGDSISTTLTRTFDLSSIDTATLRLNIWFDVEYQWDYGYVQISTDEGKTWDILSGELATNNNPMGNSFGPGYSGSSDGWAEDHIDLSSYTGQQVLVRFNYVTDDAISSTGFCLDTITVPELGFYDDASVDQGWVSDGFYRTNTYVEQTYMIWVVCAQNGLWEIKNVDIDSLNQGHIDILGISQFDEVALIIGTVARGSSRYAEYEIIVEPLE